MKKIKKVRLKDVQKDKGDKKGKKEKRSGEGFSVGNECSLGWRYVKESKNFIYLGIGIFFIFTLMGFFIPVSESLYNQIITFIQELVKQTEGMNQFQLTKFIFLNNIQSSFLGVVLGIFLGIFPIISSVFNGYLVGFVSRISVESGGILTLWKLLPHGVFELPAIFLSWGLGIRLGFYLFNRNNWNNRRGKKKESFKMLFLNSMRVFFFIILPLLIIAAMIEGVLITVLG